MDFDNLGYGNELQELAIAGERKKISVIIPCYNAGFALDRCMESIVGQTIGMDSLEIILVNDASTDNTLEKLCEWEARYPDSIMVIDCKENKRPGGARNIGMEYASGLYISLIDADDVLEENMYQALYEAAAEQCDLAICQSSKDIDNVARKDKNSLKEEKAPHKRVIEIASIQEQQAFLEEDYNMAVWNKLYLRDFLLNNNLKFKEGVMYEDSYFSELVKRYCKKVFITDEILYHHVLSKKSVSCDTNSKMNRIDYLEVHIALIEELRRRDIYEPFGNMYANKFIIHYISFMKSFEAVFGKMDAELEKIISNSIINLYPDYKEIPIVKSIMAAGQEENRKILERLEAYAVSG